MQTVHNYCNRIKKIAGEEPNILPFCIHILCFSLQVYWAVNYDTIFKYALFINAFFAFASCVYAVIKWKISWKTILLFILGLLLFPLFYMWLNVEYFYSYISSRNIKLSLVFILNVMLFLPFYKPIPNPAHKTYKTAVPFFIVLVTTFFYVLVYQPLIYYFSSPDFMDTTVSSLLLFTGMLFIGLSIVVILIYLFLPPGGKFFLVRVLVTVFLCSFLWSNLLRLKTGLLDVFVFQFPESISGMPVLLYILDPVIIAVLWYLAKLLLLKVKNVLNIMLVVLTIFHLSNIFIQFHKTDFSKVQNRIQIQGNNYSEIILPEHAKENHTFSSDKTNVVFIIADMFNGNYIGKLIEEYPEYREMLDGFIWFPDTVAVSGKTLTSIPGILAGPDFIPKNLNLNNKTGKEETAEAADFFFSAVQKAGFKSTVVDASEFTVEHIPDAHMDNSMRYVNYWIQKNNIIIERNNSGMSAVLVMLSIFNCVPYHWKNIIYDNSNWLVLRRSLTHYAGRRTTIDNMAYIDLLPEISSVKNGKGAFIYIHNNLTHSPYGINKAGNLVTTDFADEENRSFTSAPAAYYSAKKFVDILINWFEWMKNNDVYDNTSIIIISDHGNPYNDNGIIMKDIGKWNVEDPLKFSYDVSHANALMMIKGEKSRGVIKIDDRQISSADSTGILQSVTGIPYYSSDVLLRAAKQDAVRYYSMPVDGGSSFLNSISSEYRSYEISGSLFTVDSWRSVK